MNSKKKYFFIPMAIIFFIAIGYSLIGYYKGKKNIKIECRYMAYACGDCYPNYKIEKVLEPLKIMDNIIGEVIDVKFENSRIETQFDYNTRRCKICFTYEFYGDLNYSIFKKSYVLKVQEYKLNFHESCCDTTFGQ